MCIFDGGKFFLRNRIGFTRGQVVASQFYYTFEEIKLKKRGVEKQKDKT